MNWAVVAPTTTPLILTMLKAIAPWLVVKVVDAACDNAWMLSRIILIATLFPIRVEFVVPCGMAARGKIIPVGIGFPVLHSRNCFSSGRFCVVVKLL